MYRGTGRLLSKADMLERDQKIVKLRDDNYLSFKVIGIRFGISRITAYEAYHRAKKRFNEKTHSV